MNKYLKILLIIILLNYLIGIFISGNFDPNDWNVGGKIAMVVINIIFAPLIIMVYETLD